MSLFYLSDAYIRNFAHINYATGADAAAYVPRATTIVNGEALTSNSRAIVQNQTSVSIIPCDAASVSRIIFENIVPVVISINVN